MESNDDDVCRNGRGRQANGGVHFLNDAGKVVWRGMADTRPEMVDAVLRRSKDVTQSRRLLSLAAVREGKDRGEAAKIGGMDRQTLLDWVHRFNASGPEGPFDHLTDGAAWSRTG